MAYPLGSGSLSDPVRCVRRPRVFRINGTHTASFFMGNSIFDSVDRTETLRFVRRPRVLRINASRVWGGIGGAIYIPSFPQLDRQSTTFPHAF